MYLKNKFPLFFQDLVKSHLMNAVRSEVEELKEKIVKLEETISQQQIELNKTQTDFAREVGRLQAENDFLRGHVAPDVLARFSMQQQPQPQPQQQQQQQQPQAAPQAQPAQIPPQQPVQNVPQQPTPQQPPVQPQMQPQVQPQVNPQQVPQQPPQQQQQQPDQQQQQGPGGQY